MKLNELKDKKIIIVGYGIEGKATLEFLKHFFPNQTIDIADQKNGPDYLHNQNNYDIAIKSPGIQPTLLTIPYTTATNIFFANVKGITIGVTGSKGKSTTASLIYEIIKENKKNVHLVGNITHTQDAIGSPMLTELLTSNIETDYWVIELSSFMLADISYSPHISVMTSFFPEHMDYHKSVEKYLEAKSQIIEQAKPTDYFVYNPNFPEIAELAKNTKAKSVPFIETLPFNEKEIALLGKHNKQNVKGAVTVGQILAVENSVIEKAIKNFKGLVHRLEVVGVYNGVTFIDDAISTTPQSTIEAIKSVGPIGTIFLGGQDRGYEFGQLAEEIIKNEISNIVLFPDSGEKILAALESRIMNYELRILKTADMKEAVEFAYKYTPKGEICLLSTASPSYSVWKNFEEKGNLFKKNVRKIGQA